MWTCDDCGSEFDEPEEREVDLEDEYGVGDMFSDHHYTTCDCCPTCGSTEIEWNELDGDEDEEDEG